MSMEAKYIRNLTDKEMYVYGTSGAVVKLPPEPFLRGEVDTSGRFPDPEALTYYVADGKTLQRIKKDWRYGNHIAFAKYIGEGRNGEELYEFKDFIGNKIELISENVGAPAKNTLRHKRVENLKYS